MTPKRARTITTINGKRVSSAQARVSVFDNSLLYAEGLFETFLAVDNRVLFAKQHLDRLYKGAAVIDLKPPVGRRQLNEWMRRTLEAHPDRINKLRLTMTSGEAARWTGIPGKPQVILSAAPHTLPRLPYRVQVSDWRVDQDSVFRRIKTISYAIHAAALKRAQLDGFDDALMLNKKSQVAEITSANIFWCRRGRIYTPPITAGCLEGVTRQVVMREAHKLGLQVIEKDQSLEQLVKADEVFLSSSLKLVLGISEIAQGRRRHLFEPGEITHSLAGRVSRLARI